MRKLFAGLTLILLLANLPFAVMWVMQGTFPNILMILGPAAGICAYLTSRMYQVPSSGSSFGS